MLSLVLLLTTRSVVGNQSIHLRMRVFWKILLFLAVLLRMLGIRRCISWFVGDGILWLAWLSVLWATTSNKLIFVNNFWLCIDTFVSCFSMSCILRIERTLVEFRNATVVSFAGSISFIQSGSNCCDQVGLLAWIRLQADSLSRVHCNPRIALLVHFMNGLLAEGWAFLGLYISVFIYFFIRLGNLIRCLICVVTVWPHVILLSHLFIEHILIISDNACSLSFAVILQQLAFECQVFVLLLRLWRL